MKKASDSSFATCQWTLSGKHQVFCGFAGLRIAVQSWWRIWPPFYVFVRSDCGIFPRVDSEQWGTECPIGKKYQVIKTNQGSITYLLPYNRTSPPHPRFDDGNKISGRTLEYRLANWILHVPWWELDFAIDLISRFMSIFPDKTFVRDGPLMIQATNRH